MTESVDGTYRTSLLSRDLTVFEEAVYTCYNLDNHSEKDDVKVNYGGMYLECIRKFRGYS